MSAACALLLYRDDSVEVRYRDGGKLFLSPCGTEFMYERPRTGAHPVQGPERGRHRTEFVTSSCRDQVISALKFRNAYSSRPFLPSSLIPADKRSCLLNEITEVTWPTLEEDAGCVTHLEDGSVKVSSIDGHAHVYMTALQKDFTVEYLCQLSCTASAPDTVSCNKEDPRITTNKTTRDVNRSKYGSCVFQEDSQSCVSKHAIQYTWLAQHFSISSCPEHFQYPMSLALNAHRRAAQNKSKGPTDAGDTTADQTSTGHHVHVSVLPRALPLTCRATHMHRFHFWNFSLEQDLMSVIHAAPLKVVMYNDVLYRICLEGTSLVEIQPGDGSIFLSQRNCMGKYFTHYFLTGETRQVEDRLYTVRDLPPDKPRALYSVRYIISQATRFLESCCRHKLSLNPLSSTCCWEMESGRDARAAGPVLLEQSFIPDKGTFAVYSDNMVLASYLDGVLLCMIWSFANFNNKTEEMKEGTSSPKPGSGQTRDRFGWGCLHMPDGTSQLVELECPGEYSRYIVTAAQWCQSLDGNTQRELQMSVAIENCSVEAELKKIQRFNFLLENSVTTSHKNNIHLPSQPESADSLHEQLSEINIQTILAKTSKAIQDIDVLLSSRKS